MLKRVIDKLVDSQTNDLHKNRQIMNVILIANMVVDSRITQGKTEESYVN